ncbi:MAG: Holliday junction branch migration protein RuvA [Clostridia bacterium]|nr:Holliday junction branch migration protein RuvA [Clostridia bacterium]
MIGYIKGNVLNATDGVVLLENNGVGYEIICSASVFQKLASDKKGEVYTYLAVREDGVSLFGFESLEEKAMFLKLISVSGVGPKMGITVLSGMKLSDLAIKIATSDVKGLSKVKGLGKKTAERIILELREKIGQDMTEQGEDSAVEEIVNDADMDDAIIALMSLGFTKTECVSAVKGAKQAGAVGVEKIIAYAIKNIK